MTLGTRFTSLVSCRHPIQQAPFGSSATPELAIAVSSAGGLGMLSGAVNGQALARQLDLVPEGLPVGVNFLVPFLDHATLESVAARVALVEFFWGTPSSALVESVHQAGALAGWQVGSRAEALEACDAGCDLVAVQGVEAGGHVRGSVALLPLFEEVRRAVSTPLIAGGGIGTGRAVAAALVAGADAVRVGTRFLAAVESGAHPAYVDALIASGAEDTVLTTAFGAGWPDAPHRVLRSCVEAGEALGDAQVWTPDWPGREYEGPAAARALYAGESVGAVRSRQTAGAIVEELVAEAERALDVASA